MTRTDKCSRLTVEASGEAVMLRGPGFRLYMPPETAEELAWQLVEAATEIDGDENDEDEFYVCNN